MNDNVKTLPGVRNPTEHYVNRSLVNALRSILQRVEEGDIIEMNGVYVMADRSFGHLLSSKSHDGPAMHGALHMLLLKHAARNPDEPQQIEHFNSPDEE